MIFLYGKPVAESISNKLSQIFSASYRKDSYITIFLLNNHKPSIKYVSLKKKFGEKVGINVKIITWNDIKDLNDIFKKLDIFNNDEKCKGIIFQLPLPDWLKEYKAQLLSYVKRYKDIDGLGGITFGLSMIELFDFIPATPKAVINILKYYNLDDFIGKNITIISQSNLVGKPLALYFMKQGAEVFSFNKFSDKKLLVDICKKSNIIISATGKPNLVDENFVREDKSQILIDVGWEMIDGKVMGDINLSSVKDKVKAITPVPGGVGPVTVASLFENIVELDNIKRKYKNILKIN